MLFPWTIHEENYDSGGLGVTLQIKIDSLRVTLQIKKQSLTRKNTANEILSKITVDTVAPLNFIVMGI